VGFLGFGLAAFGHYAIGQRWLTGPRTLTQQLPLSTQS
jgi:hypothetical protein